MYVKGTDETITASGIKRWAESAATDPTLPPVERACIAALVKHGEYLLAVNLRERAVGVANAFAVLDREVNRKF